MHMQYGHNAIVTHFSACATSRRVSDVCTQGHQQDQLSRSLMPLLLAYVDAVGILFKVVLGGAALFACFARAMIFDRINPRFWALALLPREQFIFALKLKL